MALESTRFRVRAENSADEAERQAVHAVNEAAFGRGDEADLVDQLRGAFSLVSLVAERDATVVGHVLFSRMWIQTATERVPAVALAPVAVRLEHQRRGIGDALIREGLAMLRQQGERIVIVLGHPHYYPRFGFSTEAAARLESPFRRESFMALALTPGALDGVHGAVVYPPPFGV